MNIFYHNNLYIIILSVYFNLKIFLIFYIFICVNLQLKELLKRQNEINLELNLEEKDKTVVVEEDEEEFENSEQEDEEDEEEELECV